jgi:hypothetical protein
VEGWQGVAVRSVGGCAVSLCTKTG